MSTMSASALLRVAGLPVRLWLAAASPGLSDCLRTLNRTHDDHRAAAAGLAVRLGDEVVPRPELTAGARRGGQGAPPPPPPGRAPSPPQSAPRRAIHPGCAQAPPH
ncbi:hypothetical protein ACWEPC_29975, partial [Nonomuraea sp. NPDC004297]